MVTTLLRHFFYPSHVHRTQHSTTIHRPLLDLTLLSYVLGISQFSISGEPHPPYSPFLTLSDMPASPRKSVFLVPSSTGPLVFFRPYTVRPQVGYSATSFQTASNSVISVRNSMQRLMLRIKRSALHSVRHSSTHVELSHFHNTVPIERHDATQQL